MTPRRRRPCAACCLAVLLSLPLSPGLLYAADKDAKDPPKTNEPVAKEPASKEPAAKDASKPKDTGITQEPGGDVTEKEIKEVPFDDFALDNGFVGPVAKDLDQLGDEQRKKLDEWVAKLDDWKAGKEGSVGQRVRNYLTLCAMADMGRSEFEGETAYVVFDRLKKEFSKDQLIRAAAWTALRPKEGTSITSAPDLGFDGELPEDQLRERTSLYATKFLGRVLGKLPPKDEGK